MNRASKCILTAVALLLLSASLVYGQVTPGTPPLGSFGGGPFDTINLGNLDVHFAIPILQKAGRGLSMSDALTYDTSIWYPGIMNGQPTWTNVTNWGWQNLYGEFPFVSYGVVFSTGACGIMGQSQYSKWEYTNFVYHDASGTTHPFGTDWAFFSSPGGNLCPPNGQQPPTLPPASTAYDNSGYVLTITTAGQSPAGYVNSPDGSTINEAFVMVPPSSVGSFTITDSNGNQISAASGVYTDTLGLTALTVTGSGTSTSPIQYAYTGPSGAKSYHANFSLYNVKTQFLCSGINDPTINGVSLVSSITLPDDDNGSHLDRYTFNYEATPGFPGYTTGRLVSVTLPTGGTISYRYNGINGGILCADGSALAISRTVNPGGTWDYTRSGVGNSWATTVKDPTTPTRNQTVISFEQAIGSSHNFYETQRQSYLGSVSPGNLLLTTVTCYNGTTTNCPTASLVTPIAQTDVTLQYPNSGLQSKTETIYNTYGLVTQVDQYAYGSGGPGAVMQSTKTTYASPGNNIVNRPACVQVTAGSNSQPCGTVTSNTVGLTNFLNYDTHGNVASIQRLVTGTNTFLSASFTYTTGGLVQRVTEVNNAQTSYTYGACNGSFPTSVSEPLSLSRSMTWDCNGAVQLTATDENTHTTTTTYNDPNFWRPMSVADPFPATTTFTYGTGSSPSMESAMVFNGNNSISEQLSTMDGFGRTIVSQRQQGYHATNYDSTQTSYDIFGRPYKVTMPYMGTAGQTNSGPATTTSYDALGRVQQVLDAGTGSVTYTYNQNDVLQTLGPPPSGESSKQKQLEYDALGRLTSVCEITSGTSNGSCGQTNTGLNGYKTTYGYDISPSGYNRVTVTQNAQSSPTQTRVYLYDFLGRQVSETNPESGTTAYTYDSDSTCGTYNGDLVKRVDAVGNTTCYAHDALHRQTSITYPSGPYAASTPTKTFIYDTTTFSCPTGANVLGRLAEAYTGPSGSKITDLAYCYSARGETTDVYESTPHSGGYYHVPMSYWENGTMKTFGPFLSEGQVTITPDGEGRPFAVNDGGYYVPSILYNAASQPTQLMTSCNSGTCYPISYNYDANTGRMTQYSAALNGGTVSGTLTWNPNGSLGKLVIADPFYTADTQTCNYVADDLSRLASANCGSAWSQTFTYDPFGNLTKNGSLIWNPGYNQSTNRYTLGGTSYDANGNLLNDTFNTYTWDAEGKNVATVYPAQTWNFTNDAFGHMVELSFNSIYYQFSYLNLGDIHLSAIGQSPQYSEFPLPGGSKLSQNGGGTGVQLADWLGTVRAFYSYTGGYYTLGGAHAPFGETYTSNYGYPMGFAGQESLGWGEGGDGAITNTAYWFPERQYRSNQGRWLSPDPGPMDFSNPQSFNRYAYVNNNPLANIDPDGLEMCGLMAGGGVGCSGAGDNGSHTTMTDLFSGVYGWGGAQCNVDGMPGSCDMAFSMMANGFAAQCPNNDCTGIKYVAGAGGQDIIEKWITHGVTSSGETLFTGNGHWQVVGSANNGLPFDVLSQSLFQDIKLMRATFDTLVQQLNSKGRLSTSGPWGGAANNVRACLTGHARDLGCGGQAAYVYGPMSNLKLQNQWDIKMQSGWGNFIPHQWVTATPVNGGPTVTIDPWNNSFQVNY